MIRKLRVSNLALIKTVSFHPAPGFNVLSGSTGAGKTMILDALSLLMGARANKHQIAKGEESIEIEGVFSVKPDILPDTMDDYLDDDDDALDANGCIEISVARSISRNGRSRCYVNGRPTTLVALQELANCMIDIHSHPEHQSLMSSMTQQKVLDVYGKLTKNVQDFERRYQAWKKLEKEAAALKGKEKQLKDRVDYLSFQANEIEQLRILDHEIEDLEMHENILANIEEIRTALHEASDVLYDHERSVASMLATVLRTLARIADHDAGMEDIVQRLETNRIDLEDISREIQRKHMSLDVEPGRLEKVQQRLQELQRVREKYGPGTRDIQTRLSIIQEELAECRREVARSYDMETERDTAATKLIQLAGDLHERRKKAAQSLQKRIRESLSGLAFGATRFCIHVAFDSRISDRSDMDGMGPTGADTVNFLFSSNKGTDPMPLREMISSGELSRVMLAMKQVLADADQTPVLIFDEVDSNVGARLGREISDRLRDIAQRHQVICVTHVPQIAGVADAQWKVEKHEDARSTYTTIRRLDGEDRIRELAEMIDGIHSSEAAHAQAREILSR